MVSSARIQLTTARLVRGFVPTPSSPARSSCWTSAADMTASQNRYGNSLPHTRRRAGETGAMFDRFDVGNASVMAATLQRERRLRADDALPLHEFDGAMASGKAHSSPARRAVTEYLTAQIDRIDAGDTGLRTGSDPIHDTRVAIRRLRSTLRVFAKLFDRAAATELESELKWFAAALGDVRDCQVQRKRFGAALDRLPDELVLGPVRSDIRNTLS